MEDTKKIDPTKSYSAREAIKFVPVKMSETDFRDLLREDIKGANKFNAKTYTTNSQTRFVIRGVDLAKGIKNTQFTKTA